MRESLKTKLICAALFAAFGVAAAAGAIKNAAVSAASEELLRAKKVVIDAGHGLPDSGAVGVSGAAEQAINLDIAGKLKICLEDMGYAVVMTREDENAVGKDKKADMAERRRVIESENALTVSIHQNSFPADPSACGAQVFYAEGSEEGEKAAHAVQHSLNAALLPEKPRAEHTGDYYIVRSGAAPSIIVECGFLSNAREEELLGKSQYRLTVARAVAQGIEDYFKQRDSDGT